jgi:hypothetical protein
MLRDNDYTFGRKFREAFFIPASITDPVADGDYTRSWYLTGRYQWNDRWGSFLSFGVMEVDLHHATTTNALGQTVDRPDSQRELSSGFRWDITQHLTFKLQGSRFWGHHGTLDAKTNDAQHWMLWMGRLTVTF